MSTRENFKNIFLVCKDLWEGQPHKLKTNEAIVYIILTKNLILLKMECIYNKKYVGGRVLGKLFFLSVTTIKLFLKMCSCDSCVWICL